MQVSIIIIALIITVAYMISALLCLCCSDCHSSKAVVFHLIEVTQELKKG